MINIQCPKCGTWHKLTKPCPMCKGKVMSEQKDRPDREKLAWYILDEIAVRCSASHSRGYCGICERALEAMKLLEKPTHKECVGFFEERYNG